MRSTFRTWRVPSVMASIGIGLLAATVTLRPPLMAVVGIIAASLLTASWTFYRTGRIVELGVLAPVAAAAYLGWRPAVLLAGEDGRVSTIQGISFSQWEIVEATAFGFVALFLLVVAAVSVGTTGPSKSKAGIRLRPDRCNLAILIFVAIGIIASLALVQMKGGLEYLSDTSVRGSGNAGLGPLWFLSRLRMASLLLAAAALGAGVRLWRINLVLLGVSLPLLLLLNQRGGVIFIALAGVTLYVGMAPSGLSRVKPSIGRLLRGSAVICLLAILLIVWSVVRDADKDIADVAQADLSLESSTVVTDYYIESFHDPRQRWSHDAGSISAGVILSYMPRAFWTEKSRTLGYGQQFTAAFYPWLLGSTTLTAGYGGAWVLDFGRIGLLAGSFALGAAIGLVRRRVLNDSSIAFLAIYAVAVGSSVQILQGSFPALFSAVIELGIPVALTLRIVGRPESNSSASTSADEGQRFRQVALSESTPA